MCALSQPRLGCRAFSELRLRIEAMLLMDPSPEPVSFDTVIEIEERRLPVIGRRQCGMICSSTTSANWTTCGRLAVQFAEKNPKVASRLVLEPTKCEDPHVERLLEAFAFLAARVHLKMDDEFPEISEALLTVVYPSSCVRFRPCRLSSFSRTLKKAS